MKRKIFTWVAAILLVFNFAMPVAFGQAFECNKENTVQFSLLPFTKNTYEQCRFFMTKLDGEGSETFMKTCRNDVLACGINTGKIGLWMVPYFITYIVNFLLGLAGLICVLFIVIGGYRYVVGGLTEEKEKGKHTIRDALIGMVVALLAWTIVNVIINAITG